MRLSATIYYSCKVYIELKDTEALPILQSHYKFSLSEDADSSKSFIIFEQLPRKCRLDIVEEEIGYDIEQVTAFVPFVFRYRFEIGCTI